MFTGRAGILAACSGRVIWMSCSAVMEDRRACPCNLSVELKGLPAYPAALYVNGSAAGEALGDTTLTVWVETGGMATVTVVAGERMGMTAVLLAFGLPLLLLLIALIAAMRVSGSEKIAAIASIAVLVPYYVVLFMCRGRIKKDFGFRIIV